jgi:hypothetical protein
MIKINEFRVTNDNKALVVDAEIEDIEEFFDNVYLKEFRIDTQQKFMDPVTYNSLYPNGILKVNLQNTFTVDKYADFIAYTIDHIVEENNYIKITVTNKSYVLLGKTYLSKGIIYSNMDIYNKNDLNTSLGKVLLTINNYKLTMSSTDTDVTTFVGITYLESWKHARFIFSSSDIGSIPLDKNMFILTVTTLGDMADNTPSYLYENDSQAAAYDVGKIYNMFLANIKEFNLTNNMPKRLIDDYMRYKAVGLAIDTKNWSLAAQYYTDFLQNLDS